MNRLLEQILRTYGGAAADTLGGAADMVNAVPNALLWAARRPERVPTGVMQASVPQPDAAVNRGARFAIPFAVPGADLNGLLKTAEVVKQAAPVIKSAGMAGKRLFNGGARLEPRGLTYFTDTHEGAQSYAAMHNDRMGSGGMVNQADVRITNPAPPELVASEAKRLGLQDVDMYTPASVFDGNLHDPSDIDKLVSSLKARGYDGALLEDIPYGGWGGTILAHVPFDAHQITPVKP